MALLPYGSAPFKIPQYSTDPVSPKPNSSWILKTFVGGAGSGTPIGLLLALTSAGSGGSTTYQLSYRDTEGTTIRSTLS